MSAVVKMHTLFIDRECLLDALGALDVKYAIEGKNVKITNNEMFVWGDERFIFVHDSGAEMGIKEWMSVNTSISSFLKSVDAEYKKAYDAKMERLAEEERKAAEERKRQMIEAKRNEIILKAKEKGYYIKETREGGQIQLVLTRTAL